MNDTRYFTGKELTMYILRTAAQIFLIIMGLVIFVNISGTKYNHDLAAMLGALMFFGGLEWRYVRREDQQP